MSRNTFVTDKKTAVKNEWKADRECSCKKEINSLIIRLSQSSLPCKYNIILIYLRSPVCHVNWVKCFRFMLFCLHYRPVQFLCGILNWKSWVQSNKRSETVLLFITQSYGISDECTQCIHFTQCKQSLWDQRHKNQFLFLSCSAEETTTAVIITFSSLFLCAHIIE